MTKTFFLNSTVADYGEEEFNYLQKFLLDQGVLHTQGANWNEFIDLKVEESDTPDMGVKVGIGNAVIDTQRNDVNFKVFVFSNAVETLDISENTSGLDRVDAVILKLSRTVEPNALMNNVATIEVVDGTGATALSDEDIQTEIGADYDFIRLANVTVEDSETTILDADIADTRTRVLTTDAVQYSPTVLKFKVVTADPTSPVEGEMWYNETDNKMRYFDGTNVINMESSSFIGGNGIIITGSEISIDGNSFGLPFLAEIFGDGSDGDVVISSNTSLARDMYYNNLTVDSGVTLKPNGYQIFVKGTLTNNGIIDASGGNGTNGGNGQNANTSATSGGSAGTKGSPAHSAGTLPASPVALDGKVGRGGTKNTGPTVGENGGAGQASDYAYVSRILAGKNGGAGRSCDGYTANGGSGGTSGAQTLANEIFYSLLHFKNLKSGANQFSLAGHGGAGGGAGGGSGNTTYYGSGGGGSGGSGAAGGYIVINARFVINNGVISANGGNGGNGGASGSQLSSWTTTGTGGGGAGGNGGNGGMVVIITSNNSVAGDGDIEVNGGIGGSKGIAGLATGSRSSSGSDGGDGDNGLEGVILIR